MSPQSAKAAGCGVSFPRVSGDEPAVHVFGAWVLVFSPRERG